VRRPAHLQDLNPEQLAAVTSLEGPLLILAGAGSGKTRVLTRRVAHLVHEGVPPIAIMAVTFTNKAAGEMRARVEELVGPAARRILVSTFHSACTRFLRREAPLLGYDRAFAIYDDDDQLRLLKGILKDLRIDPKRHPPRGFRAHIDQAKNKLCGPEQLDARSSAGLRLPEVFERYERALRSANAFDFNDLVNKMVLLLEQNADVRARYQGRYRYLLVDEYQDTNHAQYRLIKVLSARPPHNLAVVGDDDQSIYAFRGADIRNILDFERDFPQAEVIRLERNYRSTGNILRAASALVAHNQGRKEKTLWTEAPAGDPLRLLVGRDEDAEAERVAAEVSRLVRAGRRPGDIAVFYRTHAASRPLEQALGRLRLPYVVVGGRRFYERREVRDVVAWLRLLLNPSDDMALLRIINVPTRGIGARTVAGLRDRSAREGVPLLQAARIGARARGRTAKALAGFVKLADRLQEGVRELPPAELVQLVAEETGYLAMLRAEDTRQAEGRLENIEALARAAHGVSESLSADTPPDEALRAFLDEASLAGSDEEIPEEDGKITMMTVHLAKGLEFPVVFVVGLVENVFPHFRSAESQEDLEEERRLAYVAFTRARQHLYLCRPRRRLIRGDGGGFRGRWADASPSVFLRELPHEALERSGFGAARRGTSHRPPAALPTGAGRRMDAFLAQARARQGRPAAGRPSGCSPTAGEPVGATARTLLPDDPSVFRPGVRVRHPAFGEGEIRACEGRGAALKVVVFFTRFGKRRLRVREARLEVLID